MEGSGVPFTETFTSTPPSTPSCSASFSLPSVEAPEFDALCVVPVAPVGLEVELLEVELLEGELGGVPPVCEDEDLVEAVELDDEELELDDEDLELELDDEELELGCELLGLEAEELGVDGDEDELELEEAVGMEGIELLLLLCC